MKRLTSVLAALCALLVPVSVGADGTVTLSGMLEEVVCTAECGACCGRYVLREHNGGFRADVNRGRLDLAPFADGTVHHFSGHFASGSGSCGQGECLFFHVDDAGDIPFRETSLDTGTGSLHVPRVAVDGGSLYQAVLAPPFKVVEAALLSSVTAVSQFEDCTGPGKRCAEGTSCIPFSGIAGPSIPFNECHIPCQNDADCPGDQNCLFVADGPGQVCWD